MGQELFYGSIGALLLLTALIYGVLADALLDLVGHLGAALIQSEKITDPTVDHLQSAHRLALDL